MSRPPHPPCPRPVAAPSHEPTSCTRDFVVKHSGMRKRESICSARSDRILIGNKCSSLAQQSGCSTLPAGSLLCLSLLPSVYRWWGNGEDRPRDSWHLEGRGVRARWQQCTTLISHQRIPTCCSAPPPTLHPRRCHGPAIPSHCPSTIGPMGTLSNKHIPLGHRRSPAASLCPAVFPPPPPPPGALLEAT